MMVPIGVFTALAGVLGFAWYVGSWTTRVMLAVNILGVAWAWWKGRQPDEREVA